MGILDGIVGQVLGGGGQQNNLITILMGVLGNQKSGGLAGLVEQFAGKGLGDIVSSWISTGENLPISAEQLHNGLGADVISQVAAKAGLSTQETSLQLSELLPQFVDKLTPDGKVPDGDILSQGMDLLKGILK